MMMGGAMGTFGSSMASLFFLWATFQQMFPDHLKIAIKEFSDHIINFFSPYVVISFPEYEEYRFNHAFAAIDTYLGAKAIDKSHKLRAIQVKESKGLVLKRDEAKVRDVYQGVHVWWELVTTGTDHDGDRTQKLTFHRRGLEIVTGSYIKTKQTKLYTNNPSFGWDTSGLWRRIYFEHPASFQTLAMDPWKKEEVLSDLEAGYLFKKDSEKKEQSESRVTLSGLLNFIDGIWSACGQERIIIFTTNHMEKLDPALIRRGRMDMHIELSYCSFEAFKVLAKNYLDVDSHPLFGEVESLLKVTNIAPAYVAEKLIAKNQIIDVDGCLEDLVQSLERKMKEQRGQDED
ncbi:BnaC02g00160D [Brassica napus]|uniref:BnaC02g00160D protein n=1 Tax=Brassica napus TaxID=3708 RepID=A0A078HS49_BRANA|nr:BnaC02g00160D [Brassica napus]